MLRMPRPAFALSRFVKTLGVLGRVVRLACRLPSLVAGVVSRLVGQLAAWTGCCLGQTLTARLTCHCLGQVLRWVGAG